MENSFLAHQKALNNKIIFWSRGWTMNQEFAVCFDMKVTYIERFYTFQAAFLSS